MMDAIRKTEELLFEKFSRGLDIQEVPLIFILASPRAGSTVIYQMLINAFNFFYFSNFINDFFPEYPVIAAALNSMINTRPEVSYKSTYGKTRSQGGPSEASCVFRNWFGGEHPSQTKSRKVIPEKEKHLVLTMKSIIKLTGLPILTKNAWNCFRIQELIRLFPNIHFLWVRRDIRASAISDLEARYRRGGPTVWNSATTANYREIQKRPYWEQVVEQQYEYNKWVANDLEAFSHGQYIEVNYEDICGHPKRELERISRYFASQSLPICLRNKQIPVLTHSQGPSGLEEDYAKIVSYVKANSDRFKRYLCDTSP